MNIGIYVYENAEVLDFAGPFEVFSTAKRFHSHDWQVMLISEKPGRVITRGGFEVYCHVGIDHHPTLDVLIMPGGIHTTEMYNQNTLAWINKIAPNCQIIASVCTGAFILAAAGILENLEVTTHWEDQQALARLFPKLNVMADKRWIEQGNIWTSAGISAGIDMSLKLVERMTSAEIAGKTARQMEYQPSGQ